MPLSILPGIPDMPMMNSSNSVLLLPSGSFRGTGEKILPQAEYWGIRLLSPPEWMLRIRSLPSFSRPSCFAI